jgi:hypothetical protein
MTPMTVISGDIQQEILDQFKDMRDFVENLPDIEGEVLSCHAVCEALSQIYPDFSRVEGTCGGLYIHSWMISKKYKTVILDMYPVAGACPFIVYAGISLLPWFRLYEKKPVVYDRTEFERQVAKILATQNK